MDIHKNFCYSSKMCFTLTKYDITYLQVLNKTTRDLGWITDSGAKPYVAVVTKDDCCTAGQVVKVRLAAFDER